MNGPLLQCLQLQRCESFIPLSEMIQFDNHLIVANPNRQLVTEGRTCSAGEKRCVFGRISQTTRILGVSESRISRMHNELLTKPILLMHILKFHEVVGILHFHQMNNY